MVIIGGGLAGLSAAESIARNFGDHFHVTLLEAKRFFGGRAGSFRDQESGQEIDYCQHVAMGCCTNFIGLLQRCDLMDSMDRFDKLQFLHPSHPPSEFAPSPWLPAPLHLAGAIGTLRYLSSAQKAQVRRALWRLMRTHSDALADQRALSWLQQQNQDPETIRDFWDVILISALGEETSLVSMKAARKVLMDGFAAARGASDVLVPRLPLRELFGVHLVRAIQQLAVDVRTGVSVQRFGESSGHDGSGDGCRFVETKQGDQYAADHVVVAVPWHSIGSVLSGADVEVNFPDLPKYAAIPASPISGIHLWFDRQITNQPHAVMVGTISQWLFQRSEFNLAGDSSGEHYFQVVISGSREARAIPQEQLVERVLKDLRAVFPEARNAVLLRSRIVSDPTSVFSIGPEVEAIRPPAHTALPWLHLAGDWIQTGWPATMEGAVISGSMSANSIARQEGLSLLSIDSGLRPGWLARLMIRN